MARFSAAVVAFYGALGIVAYWPMFPGSSQRLPTQVYGDPAEVTWFFAWTAHAIATAHNPFFSAAANVPYGVNMAQQTFAPLLGLLFAPLTLLIGPVSSVTVCFVAAMPLSAASAYTVLRRWNLWAPAAALGGLAYGFSPFMVNEGTQHLQFVFLPLPPLIVAALVKLLSGPRHPLRWEAALGGLIAAQFLISSEFLAITAVLSIGGVLISGAYRAQTDPRHLRAVIRPTLKGAGAAVAVAGLLLSYPIWYQFAGPGHYDGPPWPYQYGYNSHLLELVAPTPLQLFHPALGAAGSGFYTSSYLADDAYLGFGVLAVALILVWLGRRSGVVRLIAAIGLLSALFSFGPYSFLGGGRRITLPFYYLSKLPALGDIIPIRFSFGTAACLAALLAFGLDDIRRKGGGNLGRTVPVMNGSDRRANAALALTAVAVSATWLPAWPLPTQSVSTLPPAISRALPPSDPIVLTYPYPRTSQDVAMLWQAGAMFSFRLVGVYAMVPQPGGPPRPESPLLDPPIVQEYLSALEGGPGANYPSPARMPLPDVAIQTREFVLHQHVGAVLVSLSAPNATTVAQMFSAALGPPSTTSAGYELWVTGAGR